MAKIHMCAIRGGKPDICLASVGPEQRFVGASLLGKLCAFDLGHILSRVMPSLISHKPSYYAFTCCDRAFFRRSIVAYSRKPLNTSTSLESSSCARMLQIQPSPNRMLCARAW